MKANEAPKKIYLATTKEIQNLDTSFVGIAHSDPHDIVEPVEYIRTDAFIDKVYEWIKSRWSETNDRFKEDYTGMLFEDFKNYLKGE